MLNLTTAELRILRPLSTPKKIQTYLDQLSINHEPDGDSCMSPRHVIRTKRAHCIEAAMLAALALRLHRQPPLVLHLSSSFHDFDHVVALFKQNGHWGAISKSNHSVLRYRDPIYRTLRELTLSYFHEYTDEKGAKTLRCFSNAIDLRMFDAQNWMTNDAPVWFVPEFLVAARHTPLITNAHIRSLRRADPFEQKISTLVEWPKS